MSHLRKFSEREHWVEHINRPFVTGASNTDFKAKQITNKYFKEKTYKYFVERKQNTNEYFSKEEFRFCENRNWLQCPFWSRSIYGGAFFSSLVVTTSSTNSEITIQRYTNCPWQYFCSAPKKVCKWDRATIPPFSPTEGLRATEPFWQIQISIFKKYECKQISWI